MSKILFLHLQNQVIQVRSDIFHSQTYQQWLYNFLDNTLVFKIEIYFMFFKI